MTSKSEKLRSLFLTALMVFSVFAGSIAFAGTAAAANNATFGDLSNVDSGDATVNEQQTKTHTLTFSVDDIQDDGNTDTFTVTVPLATSLSSPSADVVDPGGENIAVTSNAQVQNGNEITFDISPDSNDNLRDVTVDLTFTAQWPAVSSDQDGQINVDVSTDSGDVNTDIQQLTVANAGSDQRGNAGTYDIASSGQISGDIGPGATVFQGEEDIRFVDENGDRIPAESFQQAGDGNDVLELPIPTDQPTGTYESSATATTIQNPNTPYSVTVQTPRVTNLEVTNQNGDDIAGGAINVGDNTQLTIDTAYNFEQAEPLDLTIEDAGGIDVTDEVLENPNNDPIEAPNGEFSFAIDEDQLDNEEYTVTVEGDEDFDFGEASQSTTFDVTTGEDATITLDQDEATRGENVRYDVENGNEGDYHLVAIDSDSLRNGGDSDSVFRNVGDVWTVGTLDNGNPAAVVEIDDGVGVGSIATTELDTEDVDVTLYEAGIGGTTDDQDLTDINTDNLGNLELDDVELTLNEGAVSLDNPTGSYFVGSEADVNGTTAPGIDDVSLYARDEGQFEFLMEISVDGDDTFEEEDVVLSGADVANDTLSLPGSYRIAAVDSSDENVDGNNDGTPDGKLSSSNISAAVGQQESLRVVDTELTVDYVSIINGQVAVEDSQNGISLNGTAPGKDSVSVSFYGPRGTYDSTSVSVDNDGTFDSESVQVGNNLNIPGESTEINQGTVAMTVFSTGRDDVRGDGSVDVDDLDGDGDTDFQDLAIAVNQASNTQQQTIDRIASETTEDTGSDDISRAFQFRLSDGQVSVDSVTSETGSNGAVPAGAQMSVSGVTNFQPDDNTVTVEVIEGPSTGEFSIESTDSWNTDGQWSVNLNTEGVEPGNYTVEASVGGTTDIQSFQVTDEEIPTDTPDEEPGNETETEPEPDPTETEPEPTETEEQTDEQTEQQTEQTEQPTTTEGGPGFTAVVALVALVAAALLAVRRRD